jgi:hypothetical protein
MRRTWSAVLGLALASAVLTTAPAEAVTEQAVATFQINLIADEGPSPASGSPVGFDATLVSGDSPIAGVPVTLTARPAGAAAYATIGHGTTAADGTVRVRARMLKTSRIQWVFAGNAQYAATTSYGYLRAIGRKVTAHAEDGTLAGRQKAVVVGRATPKKAGLRVSLWRGYVPCLCVVTGTTRIAVATIRPDGTFRLSARFANPGAKKLYVKVNAGAGNDVGYSRYLRIRVR